MSWYLGSELYMQIRWRKVGEQIAHAAWGAGIVLMVRLMFPVGWWSVPWWFGFGLPVLAVLPRELVDQWPINKWGDTVIDLAFFGMGGLIIWMI
jgi:hypothetical protein